MRNRRSFRIGLIVFVLTLIAVNCAYSAPAAASGWLDRFKDIYQLPDNVEQIQKDYEATKQQLEEQKDKLSEAMRRSQETEERLLAQNQALLQENDQLQKRLQAMEQLALDKEARNRKIAYIVSAAIALLVLYFVLGRVVRLIVWRRQRKRARLR